MVAGQLIGRKGNFTCFDSPRSKALILVLSEWSHLYAGDYRVPSGSYLYLLPNVGDRHRSWEAFTTLLSSLSSADR